VVGLVVLVADWAWAEPASSERATAPSVAGTERE